jgi:hypothetical protein
MRTTTLIKSVQVNGNSASDSPQRSCGGWFSEPLAIIAGENFNRSAGVCTLLLVFAICFTSRGNVVP